MQNAPKSEEKGTSPLRLSLFAFLLVAVSLYAWFGSTRSGSKGEMRRPAATEEWGVEVFAAEGEAKCSPRAAQSKFSEKELAYWLELAKVKEQERLSVFKKIDRALTCDPLAFEGQEREALVRAREDLRLRIQAEIRMRHLQLRRAERGQDAKRALFEVRRLRALLSAHQGPLSEKLLRLERRYAQAVK